MSNVPPLCQNGLLERLPPVRGKLTACAPLKTSTWLGAGGPAETLFEPADTADLAAFMKACPADVPITLLGIGSNTLIRDGGVPGVVLRLGPRFARIAVEGHVIRAGAGALDLNIARAARDAGLGGLEFLSGIPGTLGGGIRMNAGAYGREMKDIILRVTTVARNGTVSVQSADDLGLSYRCSIAPPDMVFVEAELRGLPDNIDAIEARMKYIAQSRADTQPQRVKTAGSTFANPPGYKAWELIQQAGCRGLRVGDAMMSEKHCNFMINLGHATSEDLENLGREVRRRVLEHSGVELRWEVRRIGIPLKEEKD